MIAGSAAAAPAAQFDPAFAAFQQARHGNQADISRSAELFLTLAKSEPTNPVVLVYAGAATSMQARTTILPWRKISFAEDGLAMIDKALAMLKPEHRAALRQDVPAVLDVQFTAAATMLAMPGFMNRQARGARLLEEVLNSPLLATAPLAFQGDVWMTAAGLADKNQRLDQARQYYKLVLERQAPQAEAARKQLKAISS